MQRFGTTLMICAALGLGGCNKGALAGNSSVAATGAPDSVTVNGVVYTRAGAAGGTASGGPIATSTAPPAAAPMANPLLGRWTSTNADCPIVDFAAASMTSTLSPNAPLMGGAPPPPETTAINYQVTGPLSVTLTLADNSKPPKLVTLSDPNHFTVDNCAYQRG